MTDPTVAQPRSPDSLAQAMKERVTRGLLLYNREGRRIHRLYGDVWAVPSSKGGFWRVNLTYETCGCQDFRYACTDCDTGEPFMNCKHVVAAAIVRAKRRRSEARPHACNGGWVSLGVEVDGREHVELVPCRRCGEEVILSNG